MPACPTQNVVLSLKNWSASLACCWSSTAHRASSLISHHSGSPDHLKSDTKNPHGKRSPPPNPTPTPLPLPKKKPTSSGCCRAYANPTHWVMDPFSACSRRRAAFQGVGLLHTFVPIILYTQPQVVARRNLDVSLLVRLPACLF